MSLYDYRLSVIEVLLPNDQNTFNTLIKKKKTHCLIYNKNTRFFCIQYKDEPGLHLKCCIEEHHKKKNF